MVRMKIGGMVLTGIGAFLIADKALSTINRAVANGCEAAKWKAYYKCFYKENREHEPIAPGYSRTTRPDKANFEIVDDPDGEADHSKDNEPKPKKEYSGVAEAVVKGVCEGIEKFCKKTNDSSSKGSDEPTEASKGQETASWKDKIDIMPDRPEDEPLYRDSLENGVEVVVEGEHDDETLD